MLVSVMCMFFRLVSRVLGIIWLLSSCEVDECMFIIIGFWLVVIVLFSLFIEMCVMCSVVSK